MAEAEGFVPLSQAILGAGLSEIKPIVGGGGFAFTKLDCSEKELTHLGNKLEDCKHLRHIVLSNNQIADLGAVANLPHVLSLKADSNAIASIECFQEAELPWCQRLDLASNQLTQLPSLGALPRLRFLRLEGNQIVSLEAFNGHASLQELELQGNQLTSLKGLGLMEQLRKLNASGNQLASLEGLDAPALTWLDISANQLASLEHIIGVPSLQELAASENQIPGPAEPDTLPNEILRLSSETPQLTTLSLAGNPVADLKSEILVCLPKLQTLDGEAVTEEDREAASEREKEIEAAATERAAAALMADVEGGEEGEGGEEAEEG